MDRKPLLWIIRDRSEWPTNEFVTLFAEEGYDAREINEESVSKVIETNDPFGMICNLGLCGKSNVSAF
jgi:hypothetical protein